TGKRFTWATPAAVTILSAPGPIGRAGHEALAEACLGIGDRGMGHALFVVGAIGRQFVAHLVERLADAGDVAMTEDRPDAAEDLHLLAVDHGHLLFEEMRDRLRHRQSDRLAHRAPPKSFASSGSPPQPLPTRGRANLPHSFCAYCSVSSRRMVAARA